VHAARHCAGGADPVTPGDILAADLLHGGRHSVAGGDPIPQQARTPFFKKITAKLAAGGNFTGPEYVVGQGVMHVWYNGLICDEGPDYAEVGSAGQRSFTIRFGRDLNPGDTISISAYALPPQTQALALHLGE
jgi:hypothetical protein